jgi:tripartite-type tricarboxylate transporter receptor subunit TctC
VVERLEAAVGQVLREGDLPQFLAAQGATVRFREAAELKACMAAGRERWTAAIKEAGITVDWARAEKGSARRRRLR